MHVRFLFAAFAAVLLATFLAACADPPPAEERVRAFVAEIERLAENREYVELVERIAGDYRDSRGNDKLKAAAILRGFFLRNRSVHLYTRVEDIRFPEAGYAAATVYVALSRRPLTQSEASQLPVANMHRIALELVEDGESFEVLQTEWERASAADILF